MINYIFFLLQQLSQTVLFRKCPSSYEKLKLLLFQNFKNKVLPPSSFYTNWFFSRLDTDIALLWVLAHQDRKSAVLFCWAIDSSKAMRGFGIMPSDSVLLESGRESRSRI